MVLFFSSNVKPGCEEICYSVGDDHIQYSSLLADQKTKFDNFMNSFAGDVGVVCIKNIPGEGIVDVSIAVPPGDNEYIGTDSADYTKLTTEQQTSIIEFVNMLTE